MTSKTTLVPTPGSLAVAVVTPEGSAFEGLAVSVVVPAFDGEVAFYPGHAPFVGAIGMGSLRVRPTQGETRRWYLEGGVVQVVDGYVTILAEQVTPAAKVKLEEAEADLERALATAPSTEEAFAERDHTLESARARKRVASPPPA